MSHEIEILEDGTASMFSGEGIMPWHGLVNPVEGVLTAEEALKEAKLDWEVEKQPIYFGEEKKIFSGRNAVVRIRDQKELGIVGNGYKLFQNAEAFSFFDSLVESDEAKYTAAGSLFGGKRIFLTAQIGEDFLIDGQDPHKQFLLITNSHDGSQALTAAVTTIRAVCDNTVTMGIKGAKYKWTLRHQSTLTGKVAQARDALAMSFKYTDAFQAEVEKMMQIQVTKDKFLKIVEDIIPPAKLQHDKNVLAIMDIFENEKTVNDTSGKGNAWGAYNALTFWTDHGKTYHNEASRFKSLVGAGFAEKLREKAHRRLITV